MIPPFSFFLIPWYHSRKKQMSKRYPKNTERTDSIVISTYDLQDTHDLKNNIFHFWLIDSIKKKMLKIKKCSNLSKDSNFLVMFLDVNKTSNKGWILDRYVQAVAFYLNEKIFSNLFQAIFNLLSIQQKSFFLDRNQNFIEILLNFPWRFWYQITFDSQRAHEWRRNLVNQSSKWR